MPGRPTYRCRPANGIQRVIGRVFGQPGLPSTRSVAESLRVNRQTVVEAYRRLESEGLVEQRVGSGTYVLGGAGSRSRAPRVREGLPVVVPGPTCSLQMKQEYPELLGTEDAKLVAENTYDIGEYLYMLGRDKKLKRDFPVSLGKVAYHLPCHLKSQNIGFRSRDLLQLAADEVVLVDACSGVDGTWGMQARFHDESMKVASGMLERLGAAKSDWVSTDCPLAALRIQKGLGVRALHPVVLLNRAYRGSAS